MFLKLFPKGIPRSKRYGQGAAQVQPGRSTVLCTLQVSTVAGSTSGLSQCAAQAAAQDARQECGRLRVRMQSPWK